MYYYTLKIVVNDGINYDKLKNFSSLENMWLLFTHVRVRNALSPFGIFNLQYKIEIYIIYYNYNIEIYRQ